MRFSLIFSGWVFAKTKCALIITETARESTLSFPRTEGGCCGAVYNARDGEIQAIGVRCARRDQRLRARRALRGARAFDSSGGRLAACRHKQPVGGANRRASFAARFYARDFRRRSRSRRRFDQNRRARRVVHDRARYSVAGAGRPSMSRSNAAGGLIRAPPPPRICKTARRRSPSPPRSRTPTRPSPPA